MCIFVEYIFKNERNVWFVEHVHSVIVGGLNQQFSIIAKSVNSLTLVSESSGYFMWSSSFNTSIFLLFSF